MSVGFFMGIRSSYIDEAQAVGAAFVDAINQALRAAGLPAYSDPVVPPDVYLGPLFGRSALDHHSARCLVEVAERAMAGSASPHLALVAANPYRVAFLPVDFSVPLETDHRERIAGEERRIWIGSAVRMKKELAAVALALGIPLSGDELTDDAAVKINDFAPLYDGDTCELAENERTSWLLMYEGARLAAGHRVALSLAG